MKTSSPLRYPGGKAAMTNVLSRIRKLNSLGNRSIAEPFAGGAGASLALLYLEEAQEIYVNDADPAIHAFWWTVVNRSRDFLEMLTQVEVSIAEWSRQRDVYRLGDRASRLRRGFSTFYLNRCNRSGIIVNGGPIGGVKQTGAWKLDARFNKVELRRRCERVAEYRDRINVSCLDAIDFIGDLDQESTFFFIDPPYFKKGKTLYLDALNEDYHAALAEQLRNMPNAAWVLTYDDCTEIRRLYGGWTTIRPFSLRYVAAERRRGEEVLITPKWMRLPRSQGSAAILW